MFTYIRSYYYAMKYNMRKWSYPYYDVKHGIGNLIAYYKLIWKDRDWDHIYWLEMNRLKLSRMESMIREHGCHVFNERDADNIHKAVIAIDRLIADEYHINAFKDHDKKWGKLSIEWKALEGGMSKAIFLRDNKTPENEELERKEFRKCSKHEDYLRKQDLRYLTDTINTYLFSWWD